MVHSMVRRCRIDKAFRKPSSLLLFWPLQTHRALPLHTEAAPSSHLLPFPSQWRFGGGGVALKLWPLSVESWAVEKRIEGFVSGDAPTSTMGMAAPQRFAAVLARPQCCRRSQRRGDHYCTRYPTHLRPWSISLFIARVHSGVVLHVHWIGGVVSVGLSASSILSMGMMSWPLGRSAPKWINFAIIDSHRAVGSPLRRLHRSSQANNWNACRCVMHRDWVIYGRGNGRGDRSRSNRDGVSHSSKLFAISLLWSWRLALLILTSMLTKVLIESKPSAVPASSQSSAAFLFN